MAASFIKAPRDILDYKIDWFDWLYKLQTVNGATDTIVASKWTLPSGIIKNSDTFTITSTTIRLTGGTRGAQYTLINTITTANGLQKEINVMLYISNREE